jgi:hypothetical protein
MTEDDVRQLLGEPVNIRFPFVHAFWWYYGPTGSGPYVTFDKTTRKVAGWQEPETR